MSKIAGYIYKKKIAIYERCKQPYKPYIYHSIAKVGSDSNQSHVARFLIDVSITLKWKKMINVAIMCIAMLLVIIATTPCESWVIMIIVFNLSSQNLQVQWFTHLQS